MTSTKAPSPLVDSEGRRPYLPHDHRHVIHKPKREEVLASITSPIEDYHETLQKTVDKIVEVGTLFGVDPHTLLGVEISVRLALSSAYLLDIVNEFAKRAQASMGTNQTEMMEQIDHRREGLTKSCTQMLSDMQEAIERSAVINHIDWVEEITQAPSEKGITQALARTRLSIEDLAGKNAMIMERLVKNLETHLAALKRPKKLN